MEKKLLSLTKRLPLIRCHTTKTTPGVSLYFIYSIMHSLVDKQQTLTPASAPCGVAICTSTNGGSHLDSTYYTPNTVLGALHILAYLIFTTTPWRKDYYYPCLTNEETEAKRGQVTCPRSHSYQVPESIFKLKLSGSRIQLPCLCVCVCVCVCVKIYIT